MKIKKNDYVIVTGCSKFGAYVATMLSLKGKSVVIIDRDKNSFKKISSNYSGFKILGDATDIEVLKEAGIEKATMLIAATDSDNSNIMISQIAYGIFKVKNIVTNLYDTEKEVIYDDFNIKIIKPVKLSIEEFQNIDFENI